MIIKSSSSLRSDYKEISALAKEKGEPIYITNNGEGDLVVMDIEAFERREEMFRLKARLEAADLSRQSGDDLTLEESRARLERIYEQKI